MSTRTLCEQSDHPNTNHSRLYETLLQGSELANEEELREKLKELQARGAHNWAAEEVKILVDLFLSFLAYNWVTEEVDILPKFMLISFCPFSLPIGLLRR